MSSTAKRIRMNADKLVKRIELDIQRELNKRLTSLMKGIASELHTTLKGQSLEEIITLDASDSFTSSTSSQPSGQGITFDAQAIIEYGDFDFPIGDGYAIKIKKIMWDGDLVPGEDNSYMTNLLVWASPGDDDPIVIGVVIEPMSFNGGF